MRKVLLAARSAVALHRLLDVLPVFAGDDRVTRLITLVPGSEFGVDALAAVEAARARTVPWDEAAAGSYDLVLAASPKGALRLLRGSRVLLPHGAGFGKTVRAEGSADSASGLDPAYLLPDDDTLVSLHALAHPGQVARLAAVSPRAAAHATVVGDPTLDRILASAALRDRYRAALGTGMRKLVVLTSTWGPESLLRRRPELPAELAAGLPHDTHQLALIVHPNEHSRLGAFDLAERLAPALDAGMVPAGPYEEWAAVLVAADALITDHGSTALYYAAARDRPVVSAYDGGEELIPGSPMARLLVRCPRLERADDLADALDAYRPGTGRAVARSAFALAERGRALDRLREELYALLGLDPPAAPALPRPLPLPAPAPRTPAAFAVRVGITGEQVRIDRLPAPMGAPSHHLAVEHGVASEPLARSAGLLYRRALPPSPTPHGAAWTAGGWAARALADYPACGTAAAVLSPELCAVRLRGHGPLLAVRIAPGQEDGLVVHADPAAVLSAVHAWCSRHPGPPLALTCLLGDRAFRVTLSPATAAEAAHLL
ncbi:translation initiation factor 2 [Streptomyces sp.]|uniref:translation initiation factor 2 n=1 Tax=Streptomyces sp. TaxID=1931 RepID=UPI002F410E21